MQLLDASRPRHSSGLAPASTPVPDEAVAPLFDDFSCRGMHLRNRIVMAPMTRWFSPGGVPGDDVADYYARRAKGGVGLILTEGVEIDHPSASGYDRVPAIFGAAALDGWRRVVAAVHAEGAAIAAQLWHVGSFRRSGVGPNPDAPGVGPHDLIEEGRKVVRHLSPRGLGDVVSSYGRAARAAAEVGFDAVEVHGAHGYLLDQFLWPQSNRRRDAYGGPIANRVRFAAEVVAEIRRNLPAAMPIIFRFSQWKMTDYAARIAETPDELGDLLRPLCDAGVDIFHPSTRRFSEPAFAGSPKSLARWTRDLTGRPVIAVGSVGLDREHQSRALGGHENALAETSTLAPVVAGLAAGDFDLVAVGRALLADAEWAAKIVAGHSDQITALRPHHLKELH